MIRNEQVALFEMGVVISNSKQDELIDFDNIGKLGCSELGYEKELSTKKRID